MILKKILVTGFEPFLGESVNPSQVLLDLIKLESFKSQEVDTLLLPVSFSRSFAELQKKIEQKKYDYIIMLGQAGGRSKISLERIALNWIETEKPDEDGYLPTQGIFDSNSASLFFTSLDLTPLKNQLKDLGFPVEISLSAGGYVCNYLYYKVLESLAARGEATGVCFIHVPYLPEQVHNKPLGTPCLELEVMKKTLYRILTDIK